jgi:hypothetical protein
MEEDQELSTNLTIADLTTIASIIEAIVNRGALKPQELSLVGSVYEKITAILIKVKNENKGNQDA